MGTVWQATIQAMQVLIGAPEMDDQEDLLVQVVETAAELAGHNLSLLLQKEAGAEMANAGLLGVFSFLCLSARALHKLIKRRALR